MLTVVTWKWPAPTGYRSHYGPETVLTLRDMVQRHYPHPHRFVCVTDDPVPDVECVPAWNDFARVASPHGPKHPSCYRRLRLFHPDIASTLGERLVSLDLDVVLTADVTPLWDRPEPIVLWGDTNPLPGSHYNGSMVLLSAGARPHVWTRFDPAKSPRISMQAKCFGSDQGWISYVLGAGEAKWTRADGVYSFRNHLQGRTALPANARLVAFHGRFDPWQRQVQQQHPWVAEHYRREAYV